MQSKYPIALPKDENGYTHRHCLVCEYSFGVKAEYFPEELFCPYCTNKSGISSYDTREQIEYVTEEAKNQIFYNVQSEVQGMLKKSFSGLKNVKFKPGHITRNYTFPPLQAKIPTEIICSSCTGNYKIFGISAICPYCSNKDTKILDANLAVLTQEINSQRGLRHIYNDVVIVFQNECQYYAIDKTNKVNFQNINSSVQHFIKEFSVNILENVDNQKLHNLRCVFAKRHVEQHNRGVYDEKYITETDDDKSVVGDKVVYSPDEFRFALEALTEISKNLRKFDSKFQT